MQEDLKPEPKGRPDLGRGDRPKLFVVDNDPFFLKFMEKVLADSGCPVVTATGGLEALDRLSSYRPDIVFVDLVMPHIDGRQLCKMIRSLPRLKDVCLVVISAVSAEEELDIHALGVDAYIAKGPLTEMKRHVEGVIQNFKQQSFRRSEQAMGIERIHPRGITRELLSVKRHFELILGQMAEGVLEIAADGRIVYVNSKVTTLLGMSEEALLGTSLEDLLQGRERQRILAMMAADPAARELSIGRDHPVKLGASEVALKILPIGEHASERLVILNDVTDFKREERALRENKELYRGLFENSGGAIFVFGRDDTIAKCNDTFAQLVEQPKSAIEGKMKWTDFVHDKDRTGLAAFYSPDKSADRNPKTYEFMLKVASGTAKYVLNRFALVGDGELRISSLFDISDRVESEKHRRSLEVDLRQAQKMEAVGTLAGGIAHDFNNILMGIQGNASLMLSKLDPQHEYFPRLRNIEKYIEEGAKLTRQLLGFARAGKYEVRPTQLNELIRRNSQLFARARREIRIHLELDQALWSVEVDQAQIEQVLLTLSVNAWNAMPRGGNLYVRTANVTVDPEMQNRTGIEAGRYAKISYADTGVGMDEKTRGRIFDPFFTTSEMGRGRGLGLASAYGIIKNHKGVIRVSSQKGAGSTFEIYLPASIKESVADAQDSKKDDKGSETILLIDDEQMILEVTSEILGQLGYRVLTAASGREALAVYEQQQAEVDLVILDVIMPDMGGSQTYERLKALNPDVKVLLSSGYSIDGQAGELLNQGCRGFIQKPYNMHQLAAKIREILDDA